MSPSATLPSFEEIASLPKIELHAHLFGSIRVPVLEEIRQRAAEEHKQTTESCYGANADEAAANVARIEGKCIDIGDAFAYFSAVYEIVRRKDDIVYALRRVLEDFSQDNVVYLELRTTLKTIPEEGIDPDNYVALLVEELKSAEKQYPMIVRLILSLNRSRLTSEVETREETVKILDLVAKYPEWIVGVDIAGDPRKGNILPALEVLEKEVMNPSGAHHGKLKVTVHTSEVEGSEKETKAVLKLAPHRIGHGCYLAVDQREFLLKEKICVEICPSSNMCTLNLRDLKDHPFSYYYGKKVLSNAVCICTDDIGLFDTSLSKELHVLSQAYNLSLSDVMDLQRSALAAAFCRDEDKAKIEEKFFRPHI
ncbi:Adenosine/AMP deaminase domain-containing protein [Toxoplasma gondii TgCatPRC2]|uniref:Adenosine/AMP deaminase domain-containing protein n=13 Tax=Toxoplasma gondii TaxID=5811 RepID=B9Q017_TOXGV|nr:Adenosine/AMP deaminase domain-containing protein [Toxoplasma gondii ME49]EPR61467.1 Adenosine/AMP deaminase domain-containing protein [Toxoplasma gondii GT1]ESS33189.1 Adenosine/AMP deaminase domain-containing protein [Toxoplasma gondii VEG]KAF4642652.1 Adenosine/AMP deaminase domain-containing protein [Toxoplasma gondii]KFG33729.1 Adenosine/AMP deaminase domain-containing protein [Toxoplasma gondii p89]KFG36925.1 Adenosine/AMP deaminase domain-containing protein [Toxoplasma gondii FOU]KF|eukprot:XP_002367803.1 Adenosine/AMP deaminase domain-containing protein [Toxoplasma gondii ME49]